MTLVPPHPHPTIGEAGQCPDCRAFNIGVVAGAPSGFAIGYPAVDGLAVIRQHSPDPAGALDTAWATGCNPGGPALILALTLEDIERSSVPLFTLFTGAEADAAAARLGLSITRGATP